MVGVDTKIWGPPAWIVVHAAAKELDKLADHRTSSDFWNCLSHVLPCFLCRHSAEMYLTDLRGQSNSEKASILHDKVNNKLKTQQLAAASGSKAKAIINSKWKKYHVTGETPADKNNILKSVWMFSFYIMCDYDVSREPYIRSFFGVMSSIFKICLCELYYDHIQFKTGVL